MPQNNALGAIIAKWLPVVALALRITLCGDTAWAENDAILGPVANPAVNSPKESLRTQLFGADAGKAGCSTLLPDPKGGFASVEPELNAFIASIVDAVARKDNKALQPLFHTRLNTSLAAIDDTFGRMDQTYGKKQNVSVFRLFALNSVDGAPLASKCDGGQETAYALYGYPLQFGLWLQLQGPKELGRVFIHIVPNDGRWNIGSFHLHQWTHAGKDWEAWAREALKSSGAGHKESAYAFYDVAAKLLDAGNHLELAARDDVVKARAALFTPDAWDAAVKAELKDYKVIYTATILVPDGVGILIRQAVPGEVSVEHIQNTCAAMATTLAKTAWAKDLAGIRCGFNLPREAPKDEGLLGSIFTSFDDAQKLVEKLAKAKK